MECLDPPLIFATHNRSDGSGYWQVLCFLLAVMNGNSLFPRPKQNLALCLMQFYVLELVYRKTKYPQRGQTA